jgi:putative transcription factor
MIGMQCELCGKDCFDCKLAAVDGVRMMLCPGCMKYGEGVKETAKPSTILHKPPLDRIRKPKVKDVYEGMNKEFVSGWNELIKSARTKKGLSREELGSKIGERTVTISKIENGDLRPSDEVVKKLEKELGISLVEEVRNTGAASSSSRSQGLTLGDFLKTEDEDK